MALLNLINNCTNLAQYEEIGNAYDAIPVDDNATDVNANISLNSCDETQQSILTKYSFATEGVGLFTVAVVGVLANILSIAVLAEKTMKTQITALLITLAVFDTVFLFCCIPVFCISSVRGFVGYLNTCVYRDGPAIEFMSAEMEDYYYYCLPFVYAMTHVAKVGSVFTTLAVSLERYFAVCKPLWIHIRRCHPANYIVSVVVFAVAFNIPKFLEFEIYMMENNRTSIKPTTLRTNEHYVVYYNFVFKTLLTELFPYCSLIFLNVCIYKEIRRSVKLQQSMRCTQPQKEEIKSANVVKEEEQSFTKNMWKVGVVLLSILCHIWKIVPDLYEAIINLSEDAMASNGGATDMPSNISQTEEVGYSATTNISNIDSQYYNTSKDLYQAYAKIDDGQIYLEDTTNETLHDILMPHGIVDLTISNCSYILEKLSKHYNLTTSTLGIFFSGGHVEHQKPDEAEEQLQSYNIEYIIDTSHLLVGINSAANFFLYLILRKNFRAATWRILACKPQPVRTSRASATVYHNTTIATTAGHSRIQGHHGNFSNAKGSVQIPSRTRQANPSSHHPLNSQYTNINQLRNQTNHNQQRQQEHPQREAICLNATNQHYAKESITINHLDDCTKDGTLRSSKENTNKDPNSSELCSYDSNTKPNGSSMVGFCFDDDKQNNSSGKRKFIHEACKQTSKIPSNDTYIELEDYKAQKDSSVESLKDKPDSTLSLLNETRVYHGQNKCKEGNQDDTVICETINEGIPETESLSDTTSIAELLITSHLDTSSATSTCFNQHYSSDPSKTLTVISANKIVENRSPNMSLKKKFPNNLECEGSSSTDDTEVPKAYKKSRNHCASAISPSSMIDSRIELKPLLNHSMHKTRVTSCSQGVSLPFHTHEDQTLNDGNIPSSNEQVIKTVNFQDQPMIRTVIFNL